MSFTTLFLVISCGVVAISGAPQGFVSQQVRLPNLDSAHIAVQRLGGNFAYTVADSGPVHGVVHYAAVPQVQYVPLAPTGVVLSGQQAAAPVAAPQPTFVAG